MRQLYTDQDEVLFDAARPVILNGVEDIVTRPDLADRAVFLTLEPIPEECRRPEAELWAAFEAERPRILGALLDAVSVGLKRLPETRLDKLPRMADFALWATACETALWPAGTFWSAYCGNRDEAVEGVIDADPIAASVRAVMATRTEWTGTASDLPGALAGALKSYRDGLAVLLPGVRLPLPEDEVGEQRSTSETLMHDSLSPAGTHCHLLFDKNSRKRPPLHRQLLRGRTQWTGGQRRHCHSVRRRLHTLEGTPQDRNA